MPPGSGVPIGATVVSTVPQGATDAAGDAQGFVVTYQITPPGGSWSEADDGTYSVNLVSGAPTDLAGNAVTVGSIGSFAVKIFVGSLSITARATKCGRRRSAVSAHRGGKGPARKRHQQLQ